MFIYMKTVFYSIKSNITLSTVYSQTKPEVNNVDIKQDTCRQTFQL